MRIRLKAKDNKALWIPRIIAISMDVLFLVFTIKGFNSPFYNPDLFLILLALFSFVTVVAMIDPFKGGVLLLIFSVFFEIMNSFNYYIWITNKHWLPMLKNYLLFIPYIFAAILFIVFSRKQINIPKDVLNE